MTLPPPLWRMPTRAQAIEVLVVGRERVEALIDQLGERQLTVPTLLGGGGWSVKDLLGHLASWEEVALAVATGAAQPERMTTFGSVDEVNAAEIDRKRAWSLKRVRADVSRVRTALLSAIDEMDDTVWSSKVPTTGGRRSARALVLGRILVGGRHGLFAHDLAHLRDLERSVKALKP